MNARLLDRLSPVTIVSLTKSLGTAIAADADEEVNSTAPERQISNTTSRSITFTLPLGLVVSARSGRGPCASGPRMADAPWTDLTHDPAGGVAHLNSCSEPSRAWAAAGLESAPRYSNRLFMRGVPCHALPMS